MRSATQWSCTTCGTSDETGRLTHGKRNNQRYCAACECFHVTHQNARWRERNGKRSTEVLFTHRQFLRWWNRNAKACHYCGLPAEWVWATHQLTTYGHRVGRLGLDRRDNAKPYRLDNIEPCCAECNRVKSCIFTCEEMREHIGPSLGIEWWCRLRAQGIEVDWEIGGTLVSTLARDAAFVF